MNPLPKVVMAEPQLQNEALENLSHMFVDYPDDPTPGHEFLEASRFDFTVESLIAMDEHLEVMRTQELSDDDWNILILRAGAYVGEVIRRCTPFPNTWNWLGFAQAASISEYVASYGMSICTAAVLWNGAGGAIFPLGKVAKYIEHGAGDSVYFYAQVIIAGPPQLG
jgi:hypothetical protein